MLCPPSSRRILKRRFYDSSRDVAAPFLAGVPLVREAALQLVAEGVLHPDPGHTFTVHPLTRAKVVELRDVRLLVEPRAAEVAARRILGRLLADM